jgi:hypothetical protein
MPYKNPQDRKAYDRRRKDLPGHEKKLARMREYGKERNSLEAERREQLDAMKLERGCDKCKYDRNSAALHYHHRDPTTKSFPVSSNITRKWSRILEEIVKCDLLCGNCHAEVEHPEKNR